MKFYKVVLNYNNRLFSYNAQVSEIRLIINNIKTPDPFNRAVEYHLGQWVYYPKYGYYNDKIQRRLFVTTDPDNIKIPFVREYELETWEVYECEVMNPVSIHKVVPDLGYGAETYLVDAVKLTKQTKILLDY